MTNQGTTMNRHRFLLAFLTAASCDEATTVPLDSASHTPDATRDGGTDAAFLCDDWGVDGQLRILPPIIVSRKRDESDGGILVVGHRDFVPTIVRVDPMGILDATFADEGTFAIPVKDAEASYRSLARRATGGFVAVGLADDANGIPDLLIDAVTAGGESDLSYCDGRRIEAHTGSNFAHVVAAVNDGFVVAMATTSGGTQTTELLRFDGTCSPDGAYGDAGRVVVDVQFVSAIFASDGTAFVLGDVDGASGNYRLFVVDAAGVVTPALELPGGGVPHMAWDGADLIIGLGYRPTVTEMTFVKVDATGSLVTSFGVDGVLTVTPVDGLVTAMAVDTDGRLLIASGSADIERFLPNGQHDGTFGDGGIVRLETNAESVNGLSLLSDQRIIVTTDRARLACIEPD